MNKNQTLEKQIFFGASAETLDKARQLRKEMTEAEKELWKAIRRNSLGVNFRRQHAIDQFIVDFYCLVIEVDGGYHDDVVQQEYDEGRTYKLNNFGIRVVRFTNEEILYNLDSVLNKI